VSVAAVTISVGIEHFAKTPHEQKRALRRERIGEYASLALVISLAFELCATIRGMGTEDEYVGRINSAATDAQLRANGEEKQIWEQRLHIQDEEEWSGRVADFLGREALKKYPYRLFDPTQRMFMLDKLLNDFRSPIKVEVDLLSPSVDSVHLSRDIAGMLHDAGWAVRWVNAIGTADRYGVWIFCQYGRDTKQGKAAAEMSRLLYDSQARIFPNDVLPFVPQLMMPDKSPVNPSTMPDDKIAPIVIQINDESP
jgi:hypothetical protein